MSCIVSVGNLEDQAWMVSNSIYSWFVKLLVSRAAEQRIASRLALSEAFSGITLQALVVEDEEFARQIAVLVRGVAGEVASGRHSLSGIGSQVSEVDARESFSRLHRMLDAWLKP